MTDLVLLVKNKIPSVQTLSLLKVGQFRGAGGLLINLSPCQIMLSVAALGVGLGTWLSPLPPRNLISGKRKKSQKEESWQTPPPSPATPPLAQSLDPPLAM